MLTRHNVLGVICPAGLLCFFLLTDVHASLTWHSREVAVVADVGDDAIEIGFPFTNQGGVPVTITAVVPSCGCTTARLSRTTYAPGESGEIQAVFTPGDRAGTQVKHVTVRTDHPDQPVVTLTLKVTIPEIVQVRPRFVYWRPGEEPVPKTVKVRVTRDATLELALPEPERNDAFAVSLKAVEPGRLYELTVTPRSVADAAQQKIALHAASDAGGAGSKPLASLLARVIIGEAKGAEADPTDPAGGASAPVPHPTQP